MKIQPEEHLQRVSRAFRKELFENSTKERSILRGKHSEKKYRRKCTNGTKVWKESVEGFASKKVLS